MRHPMIIEEGPIVFDSMPYPQISAVGDVQDKDVQYKKVGGLYVPQDISDPTTRVYGEGYPGSQGFAGRTVEFNMADGSVSKEEGPWKVDPTSLLGFSTYIIALDQQTNDDNLTEYRDILVWQNTPIRGVSEKLVQNLSQEFANYLRKKVFWKHKRKGVSVSYCQKPQQEWPLLKEK